MTINTDVLQQARQRMKESRERESAMIDLAALVGSSFEETKRRFNRQLSRMTLLSAGQAGSWRGLYQRIFRVAHMPADRIIEEA